MKKGMINALILVLVLVNLVLTIILMFTFVPANKKTSTLVDKIAEVIDLNLSGSSSGTENVAVSDLDAVSITFNDETETTVALKTGTDGKTHYLKYSITVNLNKNHADYRAVSASIESGMSIIAGSINDTISSYTFEEFDKTVVANAVLKNVQNLLESECIYSVSFSTFTLN